MKKFFKALQADSIGWWSFWISNLFFALIIAGIIVLYKQLPPFLPLYNHMPWGYSRLGKTYEIAIPIAVAFLIFLSNTIAGVQLREKYPLLARFMFVTSVGIVMFLLIFLGRMLQVIL